ncbi:MAG: FG-GAP-like repeat-containing protein, partial [Acidobacteriia bacterium]|nr:FG-GAP-like repeat-containing protein [Terriglobia bacterium]
MKTKGRSHLRINQALFALIAGILFLGWNTVGITVLNAATSCTTPSFSVTTPVSGISSPQGVAVGDFNRDGNLDLAVASLGSNKVHVVPGNNDGTFQSPVAYDVGTGPSFVAVGDFNRDGKLDLVVANATSNNVSVLFGNGNLTFQAAVNYNVGTGPGSIAMGDLNGDGKVDLAVTNKASGTVSILIGNADGTFQAAGDYASGSSPYSVAMGDLNGDGKLDLAISAYNSASVGILLGNGDGSFQAMVPYGVGAQPEFGAIEDLNRDGKLDLAVLNYGAGTVSILLGNGDGSFQAAVNYSVGTQARFAAIEDFNGDGKLDLAVVNRGSDSVSILLGNGDGTYQAAVNYGVGDVPTSIAMGDFNGDGRIDLVVTNQVPNTLSLLLNTCDSSCPGVGFTSTTVGAGTNPEAFAEGDFNRDGKLDLAVANAGSNNVLLLLGNGDGSFETGLTYNVGTVPSSIALGDFNGDGRTDLAISNKGSNNVSLLLGIGNGTFSTGSTYNVGTEPSAVITGDFNRDGKVDLAVANRGSNTVSILLGNGNGTFQAAVNYGVGSNPVSIAMRDFNWDGKLDLAVANYGSNDVSILLGNGDGTFPAAVNYSVGTNPASVASITEEGDAILVVANSGSNNVSALIGNPDGTFSGPLDFAVGTSPQSVTPGEFNRDGGFDVAVANFGSNDISIFLNNGDGVFPAVNINGGAGPYAIVVGDYNQDGRMDIVLANRSSNEVTVLLNTCAASCPAITFSPAMLPGAVTAQPYNQTITASGGSSPYNFVALSGPLPDGMTLSASGVISGASVDEGVHTFTVTAMDTNGCTGSRTYSLTVLPPGTAPPSASTRGASVVTMVSARLVGRVHPHGLSTTAYFEYGTSTSYGIRTPDQPIAGGSNWVDVTSALVLGLTKNTTYHFRMVASSLGGMAYGADRVFTTNSDGCPFPTAANYNVGTLPLIVAVGDFDGDSKSDLAVANGLSNNVSILLGNGNGTFQTALNYSTGTGPVSVVVADFNGDNKLDLAVADAGNPPADPGGVSILLGNGDGTFPAAVDYTAGIAPTWMAVGEFNGDTKLDLVVVSGGDPDTGDGAGVWILLGNGNGTFQAAMNHTLPDIPYSVAVSDFNGDGKADLAVTLYYVNMVSILLGNGNGTFQTSVEYPTDVGPTVMALGDFNNDSKLDVATPNYTAGTVSILIGNGNGTFQTAVNYVVGYRPESVVVADFTGDGKVDLAVTNVGANNVSILPGNGNGTFQGLINFGTGGGPIFAAVGDFNGDSKSDLAVANSAANNVSILLNTCNFCPAIAVNPQTLPDGFVGVVYNQAVTASGGTAPYSFAITAGSVPTGLTLASSGTLSGTPEVANAFPFTVTATDSNVCTGSRAYTVTITLGNATMTSPPPGSTLTSSSVTFGWTTGTGATEYYLQVGTTLGGQELYSVSEGTNLSATVMALPTDGSTVYARLWSKIAGLWSYNDYTYVSCTGCTATKAVMTTPAPGSTLSSSMTTFWWSTSLGSECYLQVGTTLGGQEIYSAGQGTNFSVPVPMLPTNGNAVYARLWTNIGGAWLYNDYTYTACTGCTATKAVMTSPSSGSALTASSVTFTWSTSLASQYYLQVGTVPGGQQLYSAGQGTNLSTPVSGLPIGGGNVYVRLWSEVGGAWWYNDYSYVACSGCTPTLASMTTPAPGATLSATM